MIEHEPNLKCYIYRIGRRNISRSKIDNTYYIIQCSKSIPLFNFKLKLCYFLFHSVIMLLNRDEIFCQIQAFRTTERTSPEQVGDVTPRLCRLCRPVSNCSFHIHSTPRPRLGVIFISPLRGRPTRTLCLLSSRSSGVTHF